jgi:hypothetical protein
VNFQGHAAKAPTFWNFPEGGPGTEQNEFMLVLELSQVGQYP